ncbi:hypothetical protein EC988_001573, partial [Linderina pennispora]
MVLSIFSSRRTVLLVILLLAIVTTIMFAHEEIGSLDTFWRPPPPRAHDHMGRKRDLAVVMPVNENTDLQFYGNMWVNDYLHPVCDFEGDGCRIVCNQKSTWETLDSKTICFTKALKERYRGTEFFIKLDDDAFVDKTYIRELMYKYHRHPKPVYISDFILNLDGENLNLNNTWYGNGKFYMFNRRLLDCIDDKIQYTGHRNEDAVFGAM